MFFSANRTYPILQKKAFLAFETSCLSQIFDRPILWFGKANVGVRCLRKKNMGINKTESYIVCFSCVLKQWEERSAH
jgi:hypothetical protein